MKKALVIVAVFASFLAGIYIGKIVQSEEDREAIESAIADAKSAERRADNLQQQIDFNRKFPIKLPVPKPLSLPAPKPPN